MIVPVKTFARIYQDSQGQVLFTAEKAHDQPIIRASIMYTAGYYSNYMEGFKSYVHMTRTFRKMPLKELALKIRKEAEAHFRKAEETKLKIIKK